MRQLWLMPYRPPSPGVLVDNKYRLAERIGGGGMGDVFRAENVVAGRVVAIKFLHPELSQNNDLAQRFFQEAHAVDRIRHPNIVDVLATGVCDMGPFLVMEYLDGESVGAALARVGKFEVDAAVGTAIPVLEALDAAHRAGIIHRDLKPENVFIALDASRGAATIRLLDFGIAKTLEQSGLGQGPRTRTGVVFGTPDYLSPEQATGETTIDGRSDLFAVGVLLFELLTGARPFRAPTAVATAFKVVHAEAPTLASHNIHVDPRLEAAVARLLQKEPARRFPTAMEVVRELERIVPDNARRTAALGKIINVARRLGAAEPWKRGADPGLGATQVAARPGISHNARPLDPSPRIAVFEASSVGRSNSVLPGPETPRTPRADLRTMRSHLEVPPAARPSEVSISAPSPLRTTQPTPSADNGLVRQSPAPANPAARRTPPRPPGVYQVRGPVLRSVDKVVTELFGAVTRDEVVAQLPDAYAADFRNGSINALVAYDLEALDAYMDCATETVVRDVTRWREFGRLAVDGELFNVVRTLLRPSDDLAGVIRRGTTIWARLFSFGAWRVTTAANGKVALHIGEFEPVAQPLRYWLVGIVEQTARRAVRPDVRATITIGDQPFSPELGCEIG